MSAGHYQGGVLSGRGQVRLLDGSHFQTEFVAGLAQGGVVTSFTRTETDLDQAETSTSSDQIRIST